MKVNQSTDYEGQLTDFHIYYKKISEKSSSMSKKDENMWGLVEVTHF